MSKIHNRLDDRAKVMDARRQLWFGTDYGPGDPLLWSPVSVEMLLVAWFTRKIVAELVFLSLLPGLLRA